jgi:hypothetical protein
MHIPSRISKYITYSLMFSPWTIKQNELRPRISCQRDIRDCNLLCFSESRLPPDILSQSIQPAEFSVHHADRQKELSGKKKGGGVCFMIN